MKYTITIKNGIAKVQAKGFESSMLMDESQVWEHMKEVTRIAREEGILIEWIIKEK